MSGGSRFRRLFSSHRIASTGVQTAMVCMNLVLSMARMLLYDNVEAPFAIGRSFYNVPVKRRSSMSVHTTFACFCAAAASSIRPRASTA
jgi:hypothetical protein